MTRARAVPGLALLVALTLQLEGCATLRQLLIPAPLKTGQRVRVTVPDSNPPTLTASLVALTEDSLVVGPDTMSPSASPGVVARRLALPLDAVSELEVSRGIHTNVVAGSLIGTVFGSLVGLAALCTRVHDCLGHGDKDAPLGPSLGFIGIAVGGGFVLGGTVGAFVRSEHWDQVPLTGPSSELVGQSAHAGPRLEVGVELFPSFLGPRRAGSERSAPIRTTGAGSEWERFRRISP